MSTLAPENARALNVTFEAEMLVVRLRDGRAIHVPIAWYPRLQNASLSQRNDWRLIGEGIGIHWPQLDEDLSVHAMLVPPQAAGQRR